MEYPSHYIKFPSHYIVVLPCDTLVAEFDAAVVDLDVIINTALHIGDQFQHKVTFATDVAVIDATTGEVVWNYRDKVADGWHTNEEEDPATYEFEPGRVYWDEMAANP